MSHDRFSFRRLSAMALAIAACSAIAPANAAARATDAELLASVTEQAPYTTSISAVIASRDGERLAILTRSKAPAESINHDELWLAREDGSQLVPVEVAFSPGSGTEFAVVSSVAWSADGSAVAYQYFNTAIKYARQASVVWVAADGAIERQGLGMLSVNPSFTADGRYLTFATSSSVGGPSNTRQGAVDLASRAVLFPARTDAPAGQNLPPVFAPECARAQEADWKPAVTTGPWIEQALSSPDPGCRFGANADDPVGTPTPSPSPTPTPSPSPTPTPTPSPAPTPATADDAPTNITRPAPGTGLVPISERPQAFGPTLRVRSSAKGLSRALKRGLRIKLDVAGATSLKAYLIVARPANEGLFAFGAGSTTYTIGRLSVKRPPSQTMTIAVPFTKEARGVLPQFLKITVTVRLVATDRAGNRTVVERQVALTDF